MAALHRPYRKTSSLRSVLRRARRRAGPRLIRSCTWREQPLSSMMRCARRCGTCLGVPQDDIAKIIGCAPKTLRKRFREELDRGVAEANATISGFLFAAGKAGNITAMIFWLKTRAHWRERVAANDPSTNADVGSNSDMVLVLPDNSRDPELTQLLQEAQQKYFARKRQQRQLPPSGT